MAYKYAPKNNAYSDYEIIRFVRIHQSGPYKGQNYTIDKFYSKQTGRLVKNSEVLEKAKITIDDSLKQRFKSKLLKGQRARGRITYKLEIKNYALKKDCEFGKKGDVQDSFFHFRQEITLGIKSAHDAFKYRRSAGGSEVHRSLTQHPDGRKIYGDADVKLIETTFYAA
jgi:hypothetical protein